MHQDSYLTVGNAVEIIGKVNQDLSIKVLQASDWGSNVGTSLAIDGDGYPEANRERVRLTERYADFASVNALVEANHKVKEIFYDTKQ